MKNHLKETKSIIALKILFSEWCSCGVTKLFISISVQELLYFKTALVYTLIPNTCTFK